MPACYHACRLHTLAWTLSLTQSNHISYKALLQGRGTVVTGRVEQGTLTTTCLHACSHSLCNALPSVQGRGTVVTGRVEQGIVKVGDEIEIVGIRPQNTKSTVTGACWLLTFRNALPCHSACVG